MDAAGTLVKSIASTLGEVSETNFPEHPIEVTRAVSATRNLESTK